MRIATSGAGVLGDAPPGESGAGAARSAHGLSRIEGLGAGAVRDAIVAIVAAEFRLPLAHILSPTRGSRRAAKARQVAMYLAHVGGLSLTDVGVLFGRDRTTVAHACGIVEDGRDRVVYDRRIERLECRVAQSLIPLGPAA